MPRGLGQKEQDLAREGKERERERVAEILCLNYENIQDVWFMTMPGEFWNMYGFVFVIL